MSGEAASSAPPHLNWSSWVLLDNDPHATGQYAPNGAGRHSRFMCRSSSAKFPQGNSGT